MGTRAHEATATIYCESSVVRAPFSLMPSRWMVVTSVAAISFVIGGSCSVAIGFFITPIMIELGWSSSLASSAAATFALAAFVAAPGTGVALDRFGAPVTMAFGILALSTGLLLASHSHSPHLMLAAFALAGVGKCASFYVPSAVVVTNWMGPRKSLGMGIIWGACSVGAAVFSLVIGRCIETYGWRVSCQIVALLAVALLPLTMLTIRTHPGLLHAGKGSSEARTGRGLLLSSHFVTATVSSALYILGGGCINFHVVSILIKAGYPTHWAGLVSGMSWVLSALGSLVIGRLAERSGAKAILAGCQCFCAVGILFLSGAGQTTAGVACVVAFLVLWGIPANGVIQLIPVIFAERFGPQHLGMLVGVQSFVIGIAGATAPLLTGLIYDRVHDYRFAIYLSVLLTMLGFVMALLIRVPTREDPPGWQVGDIGMSRRTG